MNIAPLNQEVVGYLKKHSLVIKFNKQLKLFEQNSRHPSLHVEILEPKEKGIKSFRIDRTYRALFIYIPGEQIFQILIITKHYQ